MRTNATQGKTVQGQPQAPVEGKKDSEKKKTQAAGPKADGAVKGNEKAKGDSKSLTVLTQGKSAPKTKDAATPQGKPAVDAKPAKEPEKKGFKPLFSSDQRMKALAHGGAKYSGKSWVIAKEKHKDAAPKVRTDAPSLPMARGRVEGSASRVGGASKKEPIVIFGN